LIKIVFQYYSCSEVVFPIWGKTGFRVAEKRNLGKPVFWGFWNVCDFER